MSLLGPASAVANYHCKVGENPLWDEREGRLYWVDIESARLFRVDHESGAHECFYRDARDGAMIGGFSFQEDGSLLLFEVDRIAVLSKTGARRVLVEGIDEGMVRFNDVIADPEGRVFAGTIGKTEHSGGLFRVDLDGTVTPLWRGTGCANGMGFTPDLQRFYWTCSTTRLIYVADYDRATGALSNRREFYRAPEAEGIPDGMTVDLAGAVWTARWGGSALLRLSPDARLVERAPFPVSAVSSAAFGGPNLDVLYVTTAGGRVDDDAIDGTLYRMPVSVPGTAEFRSRIRL
ncbi:MAG: SMP-30/gluconolactonase/LRE family protein [Polyangiaceae bacterium]